MIGFLLGLLTGVPIGMAILALESVNDATGGSNDVDDVPSLTGRNADGAEL